MRAAPPADHPLARPGFWAAAGAVLAALAVVTPLLWLGSHARAMRLVGDTVAWCGVALALLAATSAATLWWRHIARRHEQHLRWDGTGWQMLTGTDAEELGAPVIQIDLGHALLLRARRPGYRSVWLPLERRDAPATWHRLRVALGQPARATSSAATSPANGASA